VGSVGIPDISLYSPVIFSWFVAKTRRTRLCSAALTGLSRDPLRKTRTEQSNLSGVPSGHDHRECHEILSGRKWSAALVRHS
jgi:hypothetical protein